MIFIVIITIFLLFYFRNLNNMIYNLLVTLYILNLPSEFKQIIRMYVFYICSRVINDVNTYV